MAAGSRAFVLANVALLTGVLMMFQPLGWKNVRFWIELMPQLAFLSVRHPPHHDHFGTRVPDMAPLPDDIKESTEDWRAQFEAAWPKRPVVVRKLLQREHNRFSGVLDLGNSKGLKKLFNETQIPVFTHMTQDKSAVYMNFSSYMDHCEQKKTNDTRLLYARAIHDTSGSLQTSADLPWIAKLIGLEWGYWLMKILMPQKGHIAHIFPGSYPTWTQCHCDATTSIYFQMEGRKRWKFYAPDQSPYLYPYGQMLNSAFNAAVDVHRPDLKLYPEFSKAEGYEVTIEPGDVLFFPSMWWHGVENLDPMSIGMDLSIIDIFGSLRRNPIFTLASLGNPKLTWTTIVGLIDGRGAMASFFDAYLVDPEKKK